MTPSEIINILDSLITETFRGLEEWLGRESALLTFRATGEEWNIGEILEHVARANKYLLMLIDKGRRRALKKADHGAIAMKLEGYQLGNPRLEEIGVNDSFPWKCPDHMLPSGSLSIDEIRRELAGQEARLRDSLRLMPNGEGVLAETVMSVHALGKLDVYRYIYFLLMHARRHIMQMEKIEAIYRGSGKDGDR